MKLFRNILLVAAKVLLGAPFIKIIKPDGFVTPVSCSEGR